MGSKGAKSARDFEGSEGAEKRRMAALGRRLEISHSFGCLVEVFAAGAGYRTGKKATAEGGHPTGVEGLVVKGSTRGRREQRGG